MPTVNFSFLRPITLLLISGAVSLVLGSPVTYNYTGNDYTTLNFPLTSSGSIAASFALSSALPGNLDDADESGLVLNWSISDGYTSLSQSDGDFLLSFDFTTDASGDITGWGFEGQDEDCTDSYCVFISSEAPSPTGDQSAYEIDSDFYFSRNPNDPGQWEVTGESATPEPSTILLVISGSIVLATFARRGSTSRR